MGNEFDVKVEDLLPSSKSLVVVCCDYCGKETIKKFQTYKNQHDVLLGDCCKKCQRIKSAQTWEKNYGTDNPFATKEIKEKIKNTCLENYGVENPFQSKEVKEKIKNTCLEKYGVENYCVLEDFIKNREDKNIEKYGFSNCFSSSIVKDKIANTNLEKYGVACVSKNEKVKEKIKATNLKKYGVDSYFKTPECKEKIKQTNLKKYGYEYSLQSPVVRKKISDTMNANGTCKTSKQQLLLCDILKKKYGNCELNYPCGSCFLDCVVIIDGVKIDAEYDGKYWHEQRKNQDRKRDEFVKKQGYKILRIISEKEVPSIEEIDIAIQKLLKTDRTFTKIENDNA